MVDNITKGAWANTNDASGIEGGVQVAFLKPKILNLERRRILSAFTYRVGLGKKMPSRAVSINQTNHLKFFLK